VIWELSNRADRECLPIVDAHYSRQKPGTRQFVPPGRCIVLKARHRGEVKAVWVTSWPMAQYVAHAWPTAWNNSVFCNVGQPHLLSSDLITEAVAMTRAIAPNLPSWLGGLPPAAGIITMVDAAKVRPKVHVGRCYIAAGWRHVGFTKAEGHWVFQQLPHEMPEPTRLRGAA
jgi:hypothetical protein